MHTSLLIDFNYRFTRLIRINYIMTKNITKFFVGAVAALVLFVGAQSVSAAYMHTGLLKMGMRSAQVVELQKTLNGGGFLISTTGAGSPGMESSYFGAKTKAAVMAFQSAKGLTPVDGQVGVKTGTALAAMTGGSVAYPAGCFSTSGFSSTTGQPCTATANTNVPAGCSSTSGFSQTTGASCSGSTNTGGGSTPGNLTGGAGSLDDADSISSVSNEEVGEGASDEKVVGLRLTADNGSDLAITAFKLKFKMTTGSGSNNFDDYADKVSVWMGSSKVGSADVDDFSENNNEYTKTINLSGATVKADKEADFYVTVDALDNIDTSDLGNNDFTVTVEEVRYRDATGAVLTDTSTGDIGTDGSETFSFETLAASEDLELKLSRSDDDADAHVEEVSDSSNTDNVALLKFELEAQGGDMTITEIPVVFTSTGAQVDDIANGFTLYHGTTALDTMSPTDATNDCNASTCLITFDIDDLKIDEDETEEFWVKADINEIDTGSSSTQFTAGDTLTADVTTDDIEAEDANGDDIEDTDLTGSANGEEVSFFEEGINVDLSTVTYTENTNDSGDTVKVTYNISFKVTAFGDDLYIPKSVTENGASATAGLNYEVENSNDATVSGIGSESSLSSSADEEGNYYRIDEGSTETFTVSISVDPASAGFYRVQLKDVRFDTDTTGTPENYILSPESDYDTVDREIDA